MESSSGNAGSFLLGVTAMTIVTTTTANTFLNGPVVDHNHPLFLHPSDTTGSSLVSIQLVGSENYEF